MPTERHYAVDEIEGDIANLVADDGGTVRVPKNVLPHGAGEGSIVAVRVDVDGTIHWETARRDEDERRRRLDEAEERLRRLRERDRR